MDFIEIKALKLFAHHGVFAFEQQNGQGFVLDIRLGLDLSRASASDELQDSVNYGQVVVLASKVFTEKRFKLIEAAGQAVIDALFCEHPLIEHIQITVHKPHAPVACLCDSVSVTLTRNRPQNGSIV